MSYIIGNSTFYGHEVAAHEWYAAMRRSLDYSGVRVTTNRKRNSNKAFLIMTLQASGSSRVRRSYRLSGGSHGPGGVAGSCGYGSS